MIGHHESEFTPNLAPDGKGGGAPDTKKEMKTPCLLTLSNVSIELPGGRELVKELNFSINRGDVLGIIGEEGAGKSALMKLMAGVQSPDLKVSGTVDKESSQIGYLSQTLEPEWGNTPFAEFFIRDTPEGDIAAERWNDLQNVHEALVNVGLDPKLIESDMTVGRLSGGEQVKARMAKALLINPDLLLLDEPTSNLDIKSLQWLEGFIEKVRASKKIGVALISHDETTLSKAATRILHIEQLKKGAETHATLANIGFNAYLDERGILRDKQQSASKLQKRRHDKASAILRQQKSAVRSALENTTHDATGRLLAKKMKRITVQEKRLANERTIATPEEDETIRIAIPKSAKLPESKKVADLSLESLHVGGKKLAENIQFSAHGKEAIVIIGENGVGKTTLLKVIKEHIESQRNLKVAYFPQNYAEVLADPEKNALDYLIEQGVEQTLAHTLLGRVKFTPEQMSLPVRSLSDGQKAKLIVTKLISSGAPVIIADEPTRNLSPLSTQPLFEAMAEFRDIGTLIAVTHDRKFISQVGDRVLELTPQGLKEADIEEVIK